jgi:hypothetical protein
MIAGKSSKIWMYSIQLTMSGTEQAPNKQYPPIPSFPQT